MSFLFEDVSKDVSVPLLGLFQKVLQGGLEEATTIPAMLDECSEVQVGKPVCKELEQL